MIKYLFGAIFILCMAACKKDASIQVDVGYDYIPGTVGEWVIYDVDSIVYDDFLQTVDTHTYQIREIIESTYLDAQNRETMRIERYRRDSTTGAWVIKDVWAANKMDTRFEKVEENIRYVKLVFPVSNGKIWNGNVSNVLDLWDYTYLDSNVPKTINGSSFDTCLTVTQKIQDDGLEKFYFEEVYAKGVGMIYKKAIYLTKQNVLVSWESATDKGGYDLTMQVYSYGN